MPPPHYWFKTAAGAATHLSLDNVKSLCGLPVPIIAEHWPGGHKCMTCERHQHHSELRKQAAELHWAAHPRQKQHLDEYLESLKP